jgi:hypothetical protein
MEHQQYVPRILSIITKHKQCSKCHKSSLLSSSGETAGPKNKCLCVLSFGGFRASELYVLTFQNTLPGNHPKERIQLSQHGESLKSRISDYAKSDESS